MIATPPSSILLTGTLIIVHAILNYAFKLKAPDVYMDEIFHERQTRTYCAGHLDQWDDKITTPPGLYLVGTLFIWINEGLRRTISTIRGHGIPRDPLWSSHHDIISLLRPINSALNLGSFLLLYSIFRKSTKLGPRDALMQALGLLLYPIIFFFGFLYYTDAGGLFCVLSMYYLARCREQHFVAALMGGLSLLFRQTNVIWIAYVLGTSIVKDAQQRHHEMTVIKSRRKKRDDDDGDHHDAATFNPNAPFSFKLLLEFVVYMLSSWSHLLGLFWPYVLPLLAFIGFIIWNDGSIVLGDKSHHQMTFHVAQMAYYIIITALVHFPLLPLSADSWQGMGQWIQERGAVPVCLLVSALGYLIHRFTLSHPFLLADNRHYTFYIWQRVFQRIPHINLVLMPLYMLSTWWVLSRAKQATGSSLYGVILGIAVSLVLLPAHLLEPRYFTIPVIITLLEMPPRSHLSLILTIITFIAINAVTIYIFLWRPFVWGDGSIARFMW